MRPHKILHTPHSLFLDHFRMGIAVCPLQHNSVFSHVPQEKGGMGTNLEAIHRKEPAKNAFLEACA